MNKESKISAPGSVAQQHPIEAGPMLPIDLAHAASFTLGLLDIEPSGRIVRHADGRSQILEPKAMKVLVALANAQGQILSRDDLIESCWRGRIVGDNAITRVISQLRKLQNGIAEQSFSIETVTKVGYRLVEEGSEAEPSEAVSLTKKSGRKDAIIWLAIAALAALSVAWLAMPQALTSDPIRIAVLPIDHTDESAESADILTDELHRQFSRNSGFEVIGRVSSNAVARRGLSAKEIGDMLNVGYIVEGKLTESAERFSVDVSLVDAQRETSVWATSVSSNRVDIASVGAEIYGDITSALSRGKGEPPLNSAAYVDPANYRAYLTARRLIRESRADSFVAARDILVGVTEAEPEFASAWASLSRVETILLLGPSGFDFGAHLEKDYSQALEHAERSVSLAPDLSEANAAKAFVSIALYDQYNRAEDLKNASAYAERALSNERGNPETWLIYAAALVREGRTEEVLTALTNAFELDPFWLRSRAAAEYAWGMGRKQQATAMMQKIARDHPDPSDRKVAQASLALWEGNFASFVTLTREAAEKSISSQNVFYMVQADKGLSRLGYVVPRRIKIAPYERLSLAHSRKSDEPRLINWPTTSQLSVWDPSVGHQVAFQLVKQGRSDEIVEVWDELYDASIEKFIQSHGFSRNSFSEFAPWLALSLRLSRRNAEAKEILEVAETEFELRRKAGPMQSDRVLQRGRIFAMLGKKEQAVAAVNEAVGLGWPYLLPTTRFTETAIPPLLEDQTFESIRNEPKFVSIAEQIEATVQRERRKLELASSETFTDIP